MVRVFVGIILILWSIISMKTSSEEQSVTGEIVLLILGLMGLLSYIIE